MQSYFHKFYFSKKPEYIFCNSEPSIKIFYLNKKVLKENKLKGNIERHKIAIERILTNLDRNSCYKPGSIKIEFLHTSNNTRNMYFIERED